MAAPKKPLTVQVPSSVRDEIEQVARKTERSVAFIVKRALSAAPPDVVAIDDASAKVALAITTGEDDSADLLTKIKAAAKAPATLDDRIAGAWAQTRTKFSAWMEKTAVVDAGEKADDLDQGLRESADPKTSPARLTELAKSEYPRVRALVAAHASTPVELFASLAKDREPVVREAVVENSAAPKSSREDADR